MEDSLKKKVNILKCLAECSDSPGALKQKIEQFLNEIDFTLWPDGEKLRMLLLTAHFSVSLDTNKKMNNLIKYLISEFSNLSQKIDNISNGVSEKLVKKTNVENFCQVKSLKKILSMSVSFFRLIWTKY